MTHIKAYLKKITQHLKDNNQEDRVEEFKNGATELVKFIVG